VHLLKSINLCSYSTYLRWKLPNPTNTPTNDTFSQKENDGAKINESYSPSAPFYCSELKLWLSTVVTSWVNLNHCNRAKLKPFFKYTYFDFTTCHSSIDQQKVRTQFLESYFQIIYTQSSTI
jgi:hypothetical protein